ncbi:hypothetical protein KIPB_007345, partial [Kipferlia bialata]|eukprot:g7345.t1
MPSNSDVQVFVRIRPLVGEEVTRNDPEIGFTIEGDTRQTLGFEGVLRKKPKQWSMKGMASVMEQGAVNKDVYSKCVAPLIPGITEAGTAACAFCYGHT